MNRTRVDQLRAYLSFAETASIEELQYLGQIVFWNEYLLAPIIEGPVKDSELIIKNRKESLTANFVSRSFCNSVVAYVEFSKIQESRNDAGKQW